MHLLATLLTPDEEAALYAILEAPQAWCPSRDLDRAGHCEDTLIDLCAMGWIEPWAHARDGKPLTYASWCLTPWGAKQFGRYIVEVRGMPVWSRRENDLVEPDIARLLRRSRRLIFPEVVAAQTNGDGRRAHYIASRYWNETTLDPDQAERLLGAPVELVDSL